MRALTVIASVWVALAWHSEAMAASMARGYEATVREVPAWHWQYVTAVTLVDCEGCGATYWDRRIELPRRPEPDVLRHEVGHVVAMMRPDLEVAHWRQFVHRVRDIHESFAEGYRAHMEGRTRGYEREWWDTLVFDREAFQGGIRR